jgi:hypothetical protein
MIALLSVCHEEVSIENSRRDQITDVDILNPT